MTAEAAGGWREAIRSLLPAPGAEPEMAAATALALQFELREIVPRTPHRWNGPVSRAAKAEMGAGLGGDHRLGVRPVVRTTRGWARGTMTWTNLPHLLNRQNLHPEQHRWFCEFGALHRALGATTPGRDPDWVFLDDFVNPVLWALLDQTDRLGIELVGAGVGASVRRGGQAGIALDTVRDDRGLRVRPVVTVDEEPVRASHTRLIGKHGIYVVDPSAPRRIVVAPTGAELTREQSTFLGAGISGVTVPPVEVDEFLREYFPRLSDQCDIGSSDASVSFPPPAPAVLLAVLTHRARHTVEVEWQWQHGRRSAPPPLETVLPPGTVPGEWIPDQGVAPHTPLVPLPVTLHDVDAAEFMVHTLPRLRRLPGVRIETRGPAADYLELTGVPHLAVTAVPSEKHDWFDLAVTVTIDGRTVPFVPLFRALAKGRRKLLLIDGTYLSLQHPALQALAQLIEEARNLDEWEPVPSISVHQVGLWSDFEDLADEAVPAVAWRALLAEAKNDLPQPTEPPSGLRATLRPYQRQGFSWLAYLWRHRLGGILADDMGLGKTLQCLALIQHVVETAGEHRPFLVIAPTSVAPNWVSEAGRFTPGLRVRHIEATESAGRLKISDLIAGSDVVVTSYALLRLDFEAYQNSAGGLAGLILDEAQFVKNPAARVHACALDLDVPFKLAVTGTPLENSLTDLQALCAVVAPGLFPSAPRFFNDYVRPIEQSRPGITRGVGAGDAPIINAAVRAERVARLRRRIRPFLLRRTKEIVAADLPAKQEQILRIDLSPEHRDIYELFLHRERQKLFRLLPDLDRNKFIVFRSLTLLRMLALDASLIGDEYADVTSRKLDVLFEQLDALVAQGHRALVFSQFSSYLRKVAARCTAAGIAYCHLDGGTRGRADVVAEFRNGAVPVFLISLKAGGFGLNLTEADYVFLLDPWWNPAAEEQAIDRTHRIGQHRNVMVYRLVATNTIEEKVLALQQRKGQLFDAVIDDQAVFAAPLGADDIRGLLA